MSVIYVLLCESNRYYIGKTNRFIERIEEHFTNNGSYWTKKYKPLKVIETIETDDKMDEDKYTKKYMLLYGVENVRGGSYTQIVLPEYKLLTLKDELCTMNDLCFRCMRRGHFINNCYAKTTVDGVLIKDKYGDGNDDDNDNGWDKVVVNSKCDRCGRRSHTTDNCYAKKTVDGVSTDLVDTVDIIVNVGNVISSLYKWFVRK